MGDEGVGESEGVLGMPLPTDDERAEEGREEDAANRSLSEAVSFQHT